MELMPYDIATASKPTLKKAELTNNGQRQLYDINNKVQMAKHSYLLLAQDCLPLLIQNLAKPLNHRCMAIYVY